MACTEPEVFGALAPGVFDCLVLAMTKPLPDNWLATALRRAVTMRLDYPDGALAAAMHVRRGSNGR